LEEIKGVLKMKENKYEAMGKYLIITLNFLIAFGVLALFEIIISTSAKALNTKVMVNCSLFFIGTASLLFILLSLRKILKAVIKEGPFNMCNVRNLKNIAVSCFVITVCYLVNFLYNNQLSSFALINIDAKGIHTDTEFLIFFFAGFFILILAQIYKQAVEVKEENDFTI
jgi:hypothetical protein